MDQCDLFSGWAFDIADIARAGCSAEVLSDHAKLDRLARRLQIDQERGALLDN